MRAKKIQEEQERARERQRDDERQREASYIYAYICDVLENVTWICNGKYYYEQERGRATTHIVLISPYIFF